MIHIANAPCSWGVLEFDLQGEPAEYPQVLDEIRASGYTGTELGDWGFMPTEPQALAAELAARELALLGAFVPVAFADPNAHAAGEQQALRTAHLLAGAADRTPFIVLADDNGQDPVRTSHAGRIQPEHGLDDDAWVVFAGGVERIARAVREETGLRTVFHHHCAGYVETPAETGRLLELTDPDLVGLCFDTGHYTFGGGQAADGVARFAGRVWHVHFKDCHPGVAARSQAEGWDYFESVRQGVFCELGQGSVDFPDVVRGMDEMGYEGWIIVEQDVLPGMGTPLESAERNRAFLRGLGL